MPVLPEYGLSGQVAIFATSGGDEGPFLASALAEAGASVFTVARTQALLEAVLASLPSRSSGAVMNAGSDVSAGRVMADFDRLHDRVDVLVNDCRSMFAAPLSEIRQLDFEEVQTRNVKMPFLLAQQVLPRMASREYGRVVSVVSELAERGMVNGSAFAATQAAQLSLTRSLAVEWGKHNIRVNALGTGWIDSTNQPIDQQLEELLVRYTPLRRKGRPEDIAPLLVYLCSESCDYSTGQPVYVDGGLNAHP
jgi:gluconate 5-dehydrogenase